MDYPNSQIADIRLRSGKRRRRSQLRGWLRSTAVLVFLFIMLSFIAHNLSGDVEAAAPPVVNGLFYGDGDNNDYSLYGSSEYGSGLYIYFDSPNIYVALVVDRTVNDNVCSPQSNAAYTQNAGWSNHRNCKRNTDSEFASFTLECTTSPNSWSWQQGYTANVGGTWVSDNTSGAGLGVAPPGYTSGSSMAWNFNNYIANYPTNPWDLYQGGGPTANIQDWKSPYAAGSPDVVVGLDGYPATGPISYSSTYEWEWAMVYEWSADLTICGSEPIFVLAGESHHSPIKNGDLDENDDFPPDPDPDPLTDYGDLPDTYSTLESSNGARHILTINSAYLGSSPDPEVDGQPSVDATGDVASANDEDGVSRSGSTNWVPGNTVTINLDVQGSTPTADVGIWIDWNGDGDFDEANEFYPFLNLPTGGVSTVNILIPGNYNTGDSVYIRARIFNDEADAPGGSLTSDDYAGVGTTGEVEDYQWFFGPTAITLINATTGSQETGLLLVLALTIAGLIVTMLLLRRRQAILPSQG